MNTKNIVEVPKELEGFVDDSDFDLGEFLPPPEPIEDWKAALAAIEYDSTAIEITKVGAAGVIGQELGPGGWKEIHSAPDMPERAATGSVRLSDERLRETVKETLLEYATDLTTEAGYETPFSAQVYSALLKHVRDKFLGTSIGLAEYDKLNYAWKMLPQLRRKVGAIPGLIAGIIEYGDQ